MSDRIAASIVCGIVAVLCLGVAAVYQRAKKLPDPDGGTSRFGKMTEKQMDTLRSTYGW